MPELNTTDEFQLAEEEVALLRNLMKEDLKWRVAHLSKPCCSQEYAELFARLDRFLAFRALTKIKEKLRGVEYNG